MVQQPAWTSLSLPGSGAEYTPDVMVNIVPLEVNPKVWTPCSRSVPGKPLGDDSNTMVCNITKTKNKTPVESLMNDLGARLEADELEISHPLTTVVPFQFALRKITNYRIFTASCLSHSWSFSKSSSTSSSNPLPHALRFASASPPKNSTRISKYRYLHLLIRYALKVHLI